MAGRFAGGHDLFEGGLNEGEDELLEVRSCSTDVDLFIFLFSVVGIIIDSSKNMCGIEVYSGFILRIVEINRKQPQLELSQNSGMRLILVIFSLLLQGEVEAECIPSSCT